MGELSGVMLITENVSETVTLNREVFPMLKDIVIELEVFAEPELGLVWAIWWINGNELLATIPAPEA